MPVGTPNGSSILQSNTSNQTSVPSGLTLDHPQWGNPAFSYQPASLNELTFRHTCWQGRRRLTYEALKRVGTRDQTLSAFAECGSALFLNVSESNDDLKLTCNCCRSRWCAPCASARSRIISTNVERIVGRSADRWLTLTLRHSSTPLADQLDRLFESFRRLRQSPIWRENVKGGAAFIELKISERDTLWHVHLHVIVEGRWMDQRELTQRWHAITGDSFIVDIRPIPDLEKLVRYVTKYVTKPADSSVFAQPNRLDEMIVALRGRHLCYTIGTWRGYKLSQPPETGIVWKSLGDIDSLLNHAATGDAHALRWLEAAARKWPDLAKLKACSDARPPPGVVDF